MAETLPVAGTRGIWYLRDLFVNVVFVETDASWVLVDAGVRRGGGLIDAAATRLFGQRPPEAIVLTHAHFDHVGALAALAERWRVPVYVHELEEPYVTGIRSYPPGDPTVGGGLMALMARGYPRGPVDLDGHVRRLPSDGTVPGLPDWRWLATPGHAPGHVSFWRERDGALIAGDAFVATKQESAFAVLTQRPEIHGPPAYFTPDWDSAARSVAALARLRPRAAITGHGPPLSGPALADGLDALARDFAQVAIPRHGRYGA